METSGYTTLLRQSGLLREMESVANNIANASTTGFRREGVIFAEHVTRLEGSQSLSMAHASGRMIDTTTGTMEKTGGTYDLGIEGDGYFLVATPSGDRLTRAGAFTPLPDGTLGNAEGFQLLDAGGAPIQIAAGSSQVFIGEDGTVTADGNAVAQIGLWRPTDSTTLRHEGGTVFSFGSVEPADGATVAQGFLEGSNVDPLVEIARMIEVQRAYELGQKFMDSEDKRQRDAIQTLGK